MSNEPQHAAAHLEQALAHIKAALIYWQTGASGIDELVDIGQRLAILIDESGPMPPTA
jgi:hypothetical protein